jgi:hypothetical protein
MTSSLPEKPPSPKAKLRAADAKQRVEARMARVNVGFSKRKAGGVEIDPPHSDRRAWQDSLLDAFGTTSWAFATTEIRHLIHGLRDKGEPPSGDELNAALAVVDGARPENEKEAMLASQMAATHSLAMEMLGRARRAQTVEHLQAHGALATKLLRTFTAQTEALAKIKRGGEQTVRVEHVHVYPGAQAIVGAVSNRKVEGGGLDEKENQAYGTLDPRAITAAPGTALLGPNPVGHALSETRGERQEALPTPWRGGR